MPVSLVASVPIFPIERPSPAHQTGQLNKTAILSGTSASIIGVVSATQGIAAGNLAVFVVSWASASDLVTGGTVTDSVGGNTWAIDVVGSGQNPGVAVISSVLTNALPPSATITLTLASGTPGGRMYQILDYGPGYGAHDVVGSGSAATGAASQAVTPTLANGVVLFAMGFNANASPEPAAWFNDPLVKFTQQHHTGSTTAYQATADALLGADLSTFTAKAFSGTACTWAAVVFRAATPANQTVAPPVATANASQPVPGIDLAVPAPVATSNASFPTPTVAADTTVAPPVATANASQPVPGVNVGIVPPVATANASFPVPTVSVGQTVLPPVATANASQPVPGVALRAVPPVGSATASQPVPGVGVKVTPPSVATASASMPVPSIGVAVRPPVATASASAPVPTVVGGSTNQNVNAPVASASASMPVPTVSPAPDSGPRIITKRDLYDHDPNFIPFRRF